MCKQALLAVDNDFEKAVSWLKVKGIAKGMQKASRHSGEGVCQVFTAGNSAVLLLLNCETDFVAKNQQFLTFFAQLGTLLVTSGVGTLEEVKQLEWKGTTVEKAILELSGLLGEKIVLKEYFLWQKTAQQTFACYNHSNNQICSLLLLNKEFAFKEDLAMHAVALQPRFISREDVSSTFLAKERDIIVEQVSKTFDPNKPLAIKERMISGKLEKSLKDVCLLEQKFVKDGQQTVGTFLQKHGVNVEKMHIFKTKS